MDFCVFLRIDRGVFAWVFLHIDRVFLRISAYFCVLIGVFLLGYFCILIGYFCVFLQGLNPPAVQRKMRKSCYKQESGAWNEVESGYTEKHGLAQTVHTEPQGNLKTWNEVESGYTEKYGLAQLSIPNRKEI